jgi:hypothetical protein
VVRNFRCGRPSPGICFRMSLTMVIGYAPVKVGVGFDHHM